MRLILLGDYASAWWNRGSYISSPAGPRRKSTAVTGYSVRRMSQISRRQKNELETHAGKVWTFIFSLRREDAERTGYSKSIPHGKTCEAGGRSIAEAACVFSTGEVSVGMRHVTTKTPSAYTHDGVVRTVQGGVSNAKEDRIDSVQDDERNFHRDEMTELAFRRMRLESIQAIRHCYWSAFGR